MVDKKILKDGLYNKLFMFGAKTGCHQLSSRSFFIGSYQFPVCARCTGVLLGYITTIPLFVLVEMKYIYCFALCFIMFVDWFLQWKRIKMSTNFRRLITGMLGGIGIFGIEILLILDFINLIGTNMYI